MRNFIFFIRRFFNLILFLVLEIVCVVLIARTDSMQGNDILSSANTVVGLVYKKRSDVAYYFGLRKMNDSLLKENAFLRKQIDGYKTLDTLRDTLVHSKIPATDTSTHIVKYADNLYMEARVINNSVNASDNYITINRGSKDGVAAKMAVISGNGIVGRVEHVSAHFASVLSVLSSKQKVSARLKDGTFGYVIWDEKQRDLLTMTDVGQQIKVKKGDSVFTNSFSFFPADILVGVVVRTEAIKKNTMQLIYLQPSTNFHNLQYVYVVENKMTQERKQVEDSTQKK